MILNVHNICKSFDGKDILKGASFHIENNEKAAIVGINGAGKSTLLKIIIGELSADEGEVTFSKETTWGYLAQNQNINTDNTIYEELTLVKKDIIDLENSIRKAEEDMKHVTGDELSELMDRYTRMNEEFQRASGYAWQSEVAGVAKGLGFLEEEFDKKINALSGGQKRRVAIAGVLAMQPEILVLDEPMAGLDPAGRQEILGLLKRLHQEKKMTILFVSHSMEDVAETAERVLVMNDGRIVLDGKPRKIFQYEKELEQIGLGVPQTVAFIHRLEKKGWHFKGMPVTPEEAAEEIAAQRNGGRV